MNNKDIDVNSIVQELLRLQIRQTHLLQLLSEAGPQETSGPPVPAVTPSTRVAGATRARNRITPERWCIGDRVRITNRVRPNQRPTTEVMS